MKIELDKKYQWNQGWANRIAHTDINAVVSELKDIFAKFATRKVQMLYIVKESGGEWYQNIYTRYFGRAGTKSTTYWSKHFTGSTNVPVFQDNYKLIEFDPTEYATPSDETEGTPELPW